MATGSVATGSVARGRRASGSEAAEASGTASFASAVTDGASASLGADTAGPRRLGGGNHVLRLRAGRAGRYTVRMTVADACGGAKTQARVVNLR